MSLHAVNDADEHQEETGLTFEGQTVHAVRAKMTSVADLDLGSDDPLRIDQTMRLLVTVRVARVEHGVDEKTGNLVRQHTLKVVDATPISWDKASELVFGDD